MRAREGALRLARWLRRRSGGGRRAACCQRHVRRELAVEWAARALHDHPVIREIVAIPAAIFKRVADFAHPRVHPSTQPFERIAVGFVARQIPLLQRSGNMIEEPFASITKLAGIGVAFVTKRLPIVFSWTGRSGVSPLLDSRHRLHPTQPTAANVTSPASCASARTPRSGQGPAGCADDARLWACGSP